MSQIHTRSLDEWLAHLENRSPQAIELGLERIKTVAERLNLLPVTVPVITVAGTNGKGSTVASLESIYCAAGYRVGAYTSPHLLYFNERIRLNQQNISDEALCEAFTFIEQHRDEIHLTYFEMATLAALLYFKTMQAEVIILEVGMGGRLDATNIVDATLAIITTIDFDHEEYLGHTLEAIGFEKAGILRANQTMIYADTPMPASILQRARALNVKMIRFAESSSMLEKTEQGDTQYYGYDLQADDFSVTCPNGEVLVLPKPNTQLKAASSAIVAAYCCLQDKLPVDYLALNQGMQHIMLSGRQQVICDTICNVFDVSHNPQSVRLLVERLKSLVNEKKINKMVAVFSGLKDKDLSGLIKPMVPLIDEWYTAALDCKRAADESMIKAAFAEAAENLPRFYDSIEAAYDAARLDAQPGDAVVVYGSFYVVGPIVLKRGVYAVD